MIGPRPRPCPQTSSSRSRRRVLAAAVASAGIALLLGLPAPHRLATAASAPVAGSQGTDTSLPATPSAVTVHGRGDDSGLAVTVNQTKDLTNQAVSITWTGSDPTYSNPTTGDFKSTFNGNYLQIFQCWGDPDPKDPLTATNPGPPPTQCQFGGESNSPTTAYPIQDVGFEYSRVLAQASWSTYDQVTGWTDASTGFKVAPFVAVDGTKVDQQADYNAAADPFNPKPFWQDPYFSFNTSNELDFARTYPVAGPTRGRGQALFQVDTGLEAPGLGCGQALQPTTAGKHKVPRCWLVVVPRGRAEVENPSGLTGVNSVVTSPLSPNAWKNRISIPLTFRPVDSSCALGADERRIVGSELATTAIGSWQPALCSSKGTPYNYSYLSDDRARQNLTAAAYGGAGLSVFSQPVDGSQDPDHHLVYAPLTLSGVVVAFNIERTPKLTDTGELQPEEVPLTGVRVSHVFLTPRLVAKLLTESYQAQLLDITASKPAAYRWALKNPASLVTDPDFLQFNPEFALLSTQQQLDAGAAIVEESTSDAAAAIWRWILADPEASAWLAGKADPWGMVVNPIYSTVAATNPTGAAFGTPTPVSFPKSDPYCFDTGSEVGSPPVKARPICVLDWSPYGLTMQSVAQSTRAANDGGKTTLDIAGTSDTAWTANGPQKAGTRFVLSITDTASAARYGLQTAALSRAGDDGATRRFTAADQAGLLAAASVATPTKVTGVVSPNVSTTAANAYPLALYTYAVSDPTTLAPAARRDYAAFVRYAAGPGETQGLGIGNLPPGYAPLPAAVRRQALSAADAIEHPPATTNNTTTTTNPTSTTIAPASGPGTQGSPGDGSGDAGIAGGGAGTSDGGSVTGGGSPPSSASSPTGRSTGSTKGTWLTTRRIAAGASRLALPFVLLLGLLAAAASRLVGRKARHRAAVAPGPVVDLVGSASPAAAVAGYAPAAPRPAAVADPPTLVAPVADPPTLEGPAIVLAAGAAAEGAPGAPAAGPAALTEAAPAPAPPARRPRRRERDRPTRTPVFEPWSF